MAAVAVIAASPAPWPCASLICFISSMSSSISAPAARLAGASEVELEFGDEAPAVPPAGERIGVGESPKLSVTTRAITDVLDARHQVPTSAESEHGAPHRELDPRLARAIGEPEFVADAVDRAGDQQLELKLDRSATGGVDQVAHRSPQQSRLGAAKQIACRSVGTKHAPVVIEHKEAARSIRDRGRQ